MKGTYYKAINKRDENIVIFKDVNLLDLKKISCSFHKGMRSQGFEFDIEELESEINLVASAAIKSFKENTGTKFSTYLYAAASNRVKKIKSELIEKSRYMHISIDTVTGVTTGHDGRKLSQESLTCEAKLNPARIVIANDIFEKTLNTMGENWQSMLREIVSPTERVIAIQRKLKGQSDKSIYVAIARAYGVKSAVLKKMNCIFKQKLYKNNRVKTNIC